MSIFSKAVQKEIELKYFINNPKPELRLWLEEHADQKKIVQHLFSQESSQKILLPLIKQNSAPLDPAHAANFKGRVRQITKSNQEQYLIGLKGPRLDEKLTKGVVAKDEIELEITADLFAKLQPQADQGYISKVRYYVPAHVYFNKLKLAVTVEFDCLREVNQCPLEAKFMIAEIEVPEDNFTTYIDALRAGRIELELAGQITDFGLFNPVEVPVDSNAEYRELLSSRKLVKSINKLGPQPHLKKYFNE